ncbi:unnamed protein product [Protopolystoma xenopodis]|uniref:Uncharacterized protein n=1 Tax=Protopolystoma xenopodis TaxID=117903 RepID=A0A3S5FGH2_9PLAT|nr:unnamed protein product [Protopolystoma xenopodis]
MASRSLPRGRSGGEAEVSGWPGPSGSAASGIRREDSLDQAAIQNRCSEIVGPSTGPAGHMDSETLRLDSTGRPSAKTPGGRPIARAATSGFTGIGYSRTDNIQTHLPYYPAHHPHSPFVLGNPGPGSEYGNGTTSSLAGYSQTGPTGRSDQQSLQQNVQLQQRRQPHQQQQKVDSSPSAMGSKASEPVPLAKIPRTRRRTLPSIMTEPPVKPLSSGPGQARSGTPGVRAATMHPSISPSRTTSPGWRATGVVPLGSPRSTREETVHSTDNLPARAASTYIIENGIRKRVQADGGYRQGRLAALVPASEMAGPGDKSLGSKG